MADLQKQVDILTRELKEAREWQTATAEVLQVINSSPGDLAPVFDAILQKGIRLCDAASGMLWTFDGGSFRPAAARGLPPLYMKFLAKNPAVFGPDSGPARVLAGRDFDVHADLAAEELYRTGDPGRRAIVDLGGVRSAAAVALRKDGVLVGVFLVYRCEVRLFSDKQIALLQNFATQAVIAIENARLFDEVQAKTRDLEESLHQQTATSEVLQVISSSPGDLTPVFDKMLENATRVCGAEFGLMYLVEDDSLRQAALYNVPVALAAARTNKIFHPSPQSAITAAIRTKQAAQVADVRTTAAYLERAPYAVELAELGGARTAVVVPMLRGKMR
jgi:transcriptional regulator with GAF, ATPase, and Fis domain